MTIGRFRCISDGQSRHWVTWWVDSANTEKTINAGFDWFLIAQERHCAARWWCPLLNQDWTDRTADERFPTWETRRRCPSSQEIFETLRAFRKVLAWEILGRIASVGSFQLSIPHFLVCYWWRCGLRWVLRRHVFRIRSDVFVDICVYSCIKLHL